MTDRRVAWGIFFVFFAAGLRCMSPAVNTGDSGEFATAAATLSIAHPPAYPLYALLGKTAGTLFPLGNWAYRCNLLSLLLAAASLSLLWLACLAMGMRRCGAAASCLFLAAAPVFFYHSLVAEVFSLHLLSAVLGLLILAAFSGRLWSPAGAAALGLWLGLGLGNHHTLLLVFPAFLYEIWRRRPAAAPWLRAAFFFAAFFAAGFCVYLVLPLRSLQVPPLDWGHPADWSGFWKVLLRRDYGSLSLTTSGHAAGGWTWLRQIARVFIAVWREVGWPGILLGAGGFWVWTRRSSAAAPPALPGTRSSAQSAAPSWGFGLAFLFFTGPFFLLLGNPPFTTELDGVLPRFYLLPVLWFALCAGWSVDELELRLGRWSWCALLIPLLLLGQRRAAWALREDFMAYDYGRALLKSMAPGSALFMDGGDDAFYTLAFLHYAEGMRPDLELHDRGALIYRNVYGPDFRQLSKDDKEKRRLEVESRYAARTSVYYSTLRDEVLPGAVLLPSGVAQRSIWQKDAPDRAAALRRESAWPFYVFRVNAALVERHYRDRALAPFFWFGRGQELAALGQWREALRQWRFARSIGPDIDWLGSSLSRAMEWLAYRLAQSGDWGGAEEVYRDNLAFEPAKSQLWENLAVTLEKREKFDEAVSAYRKALAASPKSVNAYMGLGVVYWKSADWPKAAEAYSKALEIDPGQAQARAYLRTIEGKLKSR